MKNREELSIELIESVHFIAQKGWAPATSTNYSFRDPEQPKTYWITASGIDKSRIGTEQLIAVNEKGQRLNPSDPEPSAETLLHCLTYEDPSINCVLHTHTVHNTVLSRLMEHETVIVMENYELLKAFEGITTHETSIELPIFPNTQNMSALAAQVRAYHERNIDMRGFLLASHGLYTWGKTIKDARRHLEAFEFLIHCELMARSATGQFDVSAVRDAGENWRL
jgi:methylthioribulose-1-phosphate dehydratase